MRTSTVLVHYASSNCVYLSIKTEEIVVYSSRILSQTSIALRSSDSRFASAEFILDKSSPTQIFELTCAKNHCLGLTSILLLIAELIWYVDGLVHIVQTIHT